MANYDPNDPNKTTVRETYVEPVEKRSSPLPLIIGILLALALAYFVLTRFMGSDDTAAVEPPAATAPVATRCVITVRASRQPPTAPARPP